MADAYGDIVLLATGVSDVEKFIKLTQSVMFGDDILSVYICREGIYFTGVDLQYPSVYPSLVRSHDHECEEDHGDQFIWVYDDTWIDLGANPEYMFYIEAAKALLNDDGRIVATTYYREKFRYMTFERLILTKDEAVFAQMGYSFINEELLDEEITHRSVSIEKAIPQ